jgi:hypothetical protein
MAPWQPKEATRFTKKAKSPRQKRQFSKVANSALSRGLSDKEAIMEANAAVKKSAISHHTTRKFR